VRIAALHVFCRRLGFLAGCLLLLLLSACNSSKVPVFYLSFHPIPASVEIMGRAPYINVTSADGEDSKVIGKYPLFDSARIIKAEVVPDAATGKCGLKLYLDRHGVAAWHELTVYHRAEPMAAVMDGFYLGIATFTSRADEPGILTTNPLWTEYEAQKIVEHVESNYELGGKE
jgi:hypothetical protein